MPAAPRDAATVVLLRDRRGAGVDVFLLRRPARSSFAPDAYVFPGGTIDDADVSDEVVAHAPDFHSEARAARLGLDGDDAGRRLCAALHVGAVRETFEESGILIGAHAEGGAPLTEADAGLLESARAECLAGSRFDEVLARHQLQIAPERLTYVAHFITPESEPRRYDTRFFVAIAPHEQAGAHHAGEATSGDWYSPADVLEHHGGDIFRLLPPTRIMCTEVARHDTASAVVDDLGSRPVARVLFDLRDIVDGKLPERLPLPGDRHPADEPTHR
jgi:8-oxo-dGTP pyrophosphatase MutT (NUDIX family)